MSSFFTGLESANSLNNVYRLIFSESDFLPGLIADVYGEYIVLQILTLGMESIKDIIVEILKELMNPKGIYLRNDTPVRLSESLPLEKKAVLLCLLERLLHPRQDSLFRQTAICPFYSL